MTRLVLLAACLALFGAPAAAAQPSQITVTAEGRSSTMPDMAAANFTIGTNAQTAGQAVSDNNSRYDRVLHALRSLGISQDDIRTTGFNMSYNPPPKSPEQPQPGVRYGFSADRSISVTVRRVADVGKAVDAAVGGGVTQIDGVTFGVSNRQSEIARALRDAVVQARARAQAMAAAAGLRIVRVHSMQEGFAPVVTPGVIQGAVYRMAAPVPTQIQPSSVETTATVTVTYDVQ